MGLTGSCDDGRKAEWRGRDTDGGKVLDDKGVEIGRKGKSTLVWLITIVC